MKKLYVAIGFFAAILAFPAAAQDFYGANFTGKHTWGVNVKYDGNFWVGTHYNVRRFGNFGSRPLDFNMVAEVKLEKGEHTIAGETAIAQVYGNKNNFNGGFGLGARYGLRAEHCPTCGQEDLEPATNLSVDLSFKPGYYDNAYSASANIETEIVKLYFGDVNSGYKKEADDSKKVDIRFGDRLSFGAHIDWTNALKGGGRYHLTTDVNYSLYLGMKNQPAWNTFYDGDGLKADYPADEDEDAACGMPERNLLIGLSHSVRF